RNCVPKEKSMASRPALLGLVRGYKRPNPLTISSVFAASANLVPTRVFIDVLEPNNVVTYNSVINGFAQNGFGEEALNMYKRMQSEGLEPNRVTFLAVLSACSHAGLIEEGQFI
ncbi:pentatricopeptide repeat-containing protein mitochondrial-like, partial [Trifolium pratense]